MIPIADAQDWLIGSQIAVAIGTLVLGAIAWWTARAASKTAKAAEDQVEAQTRPLLIDVGPRIVQPQQFGGVPVQRLAEEITFEDGYVIRVSSIAGLIAGHGREDRHYLSIPLRNVGVGIALIEGIALLEARYPGTTPKPNVPPGEQTRLNFVVRDTETQDGLSHFRAVVGAGFWDEDYDRPAGPMKEPPWDGEGVIGLEVGYTDLAGQQRTRTHLEVRRDRETGRWSMSRVTHQFDAGPFQTDVAQVRR